MDILGNLHPAFRVAAFGPASTEDEINALTSMSPVLVPKDYLELIRKMSDAEILIKEHVYVRIWGAVTAVSTNEASCVQQSIPESLAIGDDEGGMALILMSGKQGCGLYKSDFGDLDPADATYIARSLSEFLITGVGAETF